MLEAEKAGVPAPRTVLASDEEAIRAAGPAALPRQAGRGPGVRRDVRREGRGRAEPRRRRRGLAPRPRARVRHDRAGARPGRHRPHLLALHLRRARRRAARQRRRPQGAPEPDRLRDVGGLRGRLRARGRGAGPAAAPLGGLHRVRARRDGARPAGRLLQADRGQHTCADLGRAGHDPRLRPRRARLSRPGRREGRAARDVQGGRALDLPRQGRGSRSSSRGGGGSASASSPRPTSAAARCAPASPRTTCAGRSRRSGTSAGGPDARRAGRPRELHAPVRPRAGLGPGASRARRRPRHLAVRLRRPARA